MSKPLWWKNAVKLIKHFTTEESYMTFEAINDDVYFVYHTIVDGVEVDFEETVSKDALSSPDHIQAQLRTEVHESLRLCVMNYSDEVSKGYWAI